MTPPLVKYTPAAFGLLEDMIVTSLEAVRPPERLTVSEAAQKYVRIKEKNYSGPWSADKTPHPVAKLQSWSEAEIAGVGDETCLG